MPANRRQTNIGFRIARDVDPATLASVERVAPATPEANCPDPLFTAKPITGRLGLAVHQLGNRLNLTDHCLASDTEFAYQSDVKLAAAPFSLHVPRRACNGQKDVHEDAVLIRVLDAPERDNVIAALADRDNLQELFPDGYAYAGPEFVQTDFFYHEGEPSFAYIFGTRFLEVKEQSLEIKINQIIDAGKDRNILAHKENFSLMVYIPAYSCRPSDAQPVDIIHVDMGLGVELSRHRDGSRWE